MTSQICQVNAQHTGKDYRSISREFGLHWLIVKRAVLLLSIVCSRLCRYDADVPEVYWKNVLWTDDTKVDVFGSSTSYPICEPLWWQDHDLGLFCCRWLKMAFHYGALISQLYKKTLRVTIKVSIQERQSQRQSG